MDSVIQNIKALGTLILRKYTPAPTPVTNVGGTYPVTQGNSTVAIPVVGITSPFAVIANANWETTISPSITGNVITFTFSATAPASAFVNFLAVPTNTGYASIQPVAQNATQITVTIPTGFTATQATQAVQATAAWNTTVYLISSTSTTVTLGFGTMAPAAAVCYVVFLKTSSGQQNISPTSTSTTQAISSSYPLEAFALPNWNTVCAVSVTPTLITIGFAIAAPTNATLNWAFVAS